MQFVSSQLPMPVGWQLSSGSNGGVPNSRAEAISSLQGMGSGPQSYPGTGTSSHSLSLAAAAAWGDPAAVAAGQLGPGGLSAAQLLQLQQIQSMVAGSGSTSSNRGAGAAAGPTLPPGSLPTGYSDAAVVGFGLEASGSGIQEADLPGSLLPVSVPSRLGGSLLQRADSSPDSPFSSSSKKPFDERLLDARASFTDARPGWDAGTGSPVFDPTGVTVTAASADALFASKEAPAAVSGSDPVGVADSCSASAPVAVAAQGKVAHSSSYTEVSAGGLVSRTHPTSSSMSDTDRLLLQQEQQQEQEWQRPKQRHRPKRE